MAQTKDVLQVQPAVSDSTTFYLEMQPTTNGITPTVFANPNLTFVPATNTLGLTGSMNLNGLFFPNNSAEKRIAPTITNGYVQISLIDATIFDLTLNANITNFSITGVQPIGRVSSFVLVTTGDGNTRAVVWPTNFKWPSGIAPGITSTYGKRDVYVFFTVDGGSTWQSFITGQNL